MADGGAAGTAVGCVGGMATGEPPDPLKPPDVEPADAVPTGGIGNWSPRNDGSTAMTVSGSVEPSTVKNHVGTRMFVPPLVDPSLLVVAPLALY
jgi:hypothetical protein